MSLAGKAVWLFQSSSSGLYNPRGKWIFLSLWMIRIKQHKAIRRPRWWSCVLRSWGSRPCKMSSHLSIICIISIVLNSNSWLLMTLIQIHPFTFSQVSLPQHGQNQQKNCLNLSWFGKETCVCTRNQKTLWWWVLCSSSFPWWLWDKGSPSFPWCPPYHPGREWQ